MNYVLEAGEGKHVSRRDPARLLELFELTPNGGVCYMSTLEGYIDG